MSRRYPTAELYEERQREFYANSNRSSRPYADLEDDLRSDYRPGRTPDFLREDYGRTAAGPLVLARDRTASDDFDRRSVATGRRGEVEKEELIIRDRRDSHRNREVERDEYTYRRDNTSRRPRERETEETDVVIRRREQSRGPPPRREVEREEIDIRRETRETRSPPHHRSHSVSEREFEREDIRFRRGPGKPPREVEREEIIYRRDERESRPPERTVEHESLVIRPRERSLPPPRLVAREREDFVVRRRRSPSPISPPMERKEEIIIRRTEREPTPPPRVATPPPPPPEPVVRPPIIQEVITHHRHIDHGVERARSPTPPPLPPSPPKEDSLEIAIRRSHTEGRRGFEETDIVIDRETRETRDRHTRFDMELSRRRSLSTPRRRYMDDDVQAEADFYNRKVAERAYIGEAYNGATKDWAIVDVPPGTTRVKMDGVGGGSQEVTWQRYNGVRRSKFISDDDVYDGGFGAPPSAPARKKDMWTEITKDLVIKEAIDTMGYEYDETDYFYYVQEYLRYEDVLQLVELSSQIRRDRHARLREIEFERTREIDHAPRRRNMDERVYEREVIYDRRRDRY